MLPEPARIHPQSMPGTICQQRRTGYAPTSATPLPHLLADLVPREGELKALELDHKHVGRSIHRHALHRAHRLLLLGALVLVGAIQHLACGRRSRSRGSRLRLVLVQNKGLGSLLPCRGCEGKKTSAEGRGGPQQLGKQARTCEFQQPCPLPALPADTPFRTPHLL